MSSAEDLLRLATTDAIQNTTSKGHALGKTATTDIVVDDKVSVVAVAWALARKRTFKMAVAVSRDLSQGTSTVMITLVITSLQVRLLLRTGATCGAVLSYGCH